jgi:hypothetical protein
VSPGYQAPSPSQMRAPNADADRRAREGSVKPHLEPGEEALVIQPVRPKGGRWSTLTFPRLEVTPAVVKLPKLSLLAVSARRFLIVSHDPATDAPSAMLISGSIDEVRSVRRARALGATEVSWTAGGTQYVVWAIRSRAKQIEQALQRS